MARTKAELEKMMADLQAELDSAHDEDEMLCVELPNGDKVYLKGDRLHNYLRKHGLHEEDVEIEEVEEEEVIEKPARKTAAKKTVAKKTAAKPRVVKKVEESLEDIEDEIDEEAESEEPPRSYWG